jgi:hypothetical protein
MLPASLEERRTYIHTKTVIVDDVWATIGSANANVRSYTNDTEINCCFIDGRTDANGLRVSVRDYRRALWAEHLGMRIAEVPEQPGNDPAVVKLWEDRVAAVASVPESGTSPDPVGSRLYDWPVADVHVDRSLPPSVAWLRKVFDGPPVPIPLPGSGITGVPLYWWLVEEYGKLPWALNHEVLMPPRLGTAQFAVDGADGADGAEYTAYDLVEHTEQQPQHLAPERHEAPAPR